MKDQTMNAQPGLRVDPVPTGAAALLHTAAPGPQQPVDRLAYLFRTSFWQGAVHPLFHPLQLHRPQVQPGAYALGAPAPVAHWAPHRLQAEDVRRRVGELPPLPQATLRALRTLRREDASLQELSLDLAWDPSLTARILRLANSPFYGVPGRVASVRDAAQILGRRTLESVLTLAAVAGQFEGPRSTHFDVPAFWRHALAVAIAARGLARMAGVDEDQAFVAGLLHDVGLLAMSVYFPEALDELLTQARAADVELCVVERAHCLTSHAEVGAWIAAHWHFPGAVAQAIAGHHAPLAQPPDAFALACVVHVADAVAHALDVAGVAHELVPGVEAAALQRTAIDEPAFGRLLLDIESGVQALCAALAL